MSILDRAQRKLFADFFEKFAVALATAVAAKVFFAEEGMTVMTYCAISAMFLSLALSIVLVHGTEEKREGERGRLIAAREDDGKAQRKRRNGKSVR